MSDQERRFPEKMAHVSKKINLAGFFAGMVIGGNTGGAIALLNALSYFASGSLEKRFSSMRSSQG